MGRIMLALVLTLLVAQNVYSQALTYNAKDFGAIPDDAIEDTSAIQSMIDKAPNGAMLYFPKGTYLARNLKITNRNNLQFFGDGWLSVIKRVPPAPRIATFTNTNDLVIRNLAFDTNGTVSYGGVVFYTTKRVWIHQTRFFDSNPYPNKPTDRYAYVFGWGTEMHEDITITDNLIEDLQLEVDGVRRAHIADNTVLRSVRTCGIGISLLKDGQLVEDYFITRNTVIDPIGIGFLLDIDSPYLKNTINRRIRFLNNRVIRTKTAGYAFLVGTPNNGVATTGNVYEDITIEGNVIEIFPSAPPQGDIIRANSSGIAGIVFNRLSIQNNIIKSNGSGTGIIAQQIKNSTIARNILQKVIKGVVVGGNLENNKVQDNFVN